MSNLLKRYREEIKPNLQRELNLDNPMAVPRLIKIVVNVGLGEAVSNRQVLKEASKQLAMITGQQPQVTRARRSIASFKVRAGTPIGLKVTLRRKRMYDFLEKLIRVVLPRLRDFRGISEKSIDEQGNLTIGFAEQIVFPEIEYSQIDKIRGLEVTIVTTAKSAKECKRLLEMFGMPFTGYQPKPKN